MADDHHGGVGDGLERRRGRRRRHRHDRHLLDALTVRQRWQLIAIIAAWAGGLAWSWGWWLQPEHTTSTLTLIVNTGLLGVETTLLPMWFFFFLWRMKRPGSIPVPDLRTAIVVTKAPSEPWPMVQVTLLAMLDQDFPFPYDVWLADEQPDAQTRDWCQASGVRLSTRQGIPDYHRATWPRRTRCKEGNLAYFYDTYGYEAYDVVAQLDADHVPARSYLTHMVRPFSDPHVGYVAAPSICDSNAQSSWSARGRLYVEAVLHGPTQAGHSGGYAPTCIGSHYAVRTIALREVGGLGPELAEDFTTTLMLGSHGWQGVFAVDAEAHGAGPATVADCVTQDFQWSRSMMNVLLGTGYGYWRHLSPAGKARLGFCLMWYPLFSVLMLASTVMPIVAIVTQTPLVSVSLTAFYLHFAPPMLILLILIVWLRRLEFLRPRTARIISWEAPLFQLVRWPWVLVGCAHAIAGRIAAREFAFCVTPKGREGAAPLPMRVVAPSLLIALASAAPVLAGLDPGAAAGYRTLALLNAGLYLCVASAILVLHVREHPRALRVEVLRHLSAKVVATLATATVIGLALTQAGPLPAPDALAAGGTPPWPIIAASPRSLTVGVTTDALARNSAKAWEVDDLRQVNQFEQAAQGHAGIVQWFADWEHAPRVDLAQLRAVAARGSMSQITWEPWDYSKGLRRRQAKYALASIYEGRHDAYIRTWARDLRAFGGPVQLRFAQEMNGTHYPWSQASFGNRRGDYRRAWRYIHDIFVAEGATNVRWVWSPVSGRQDALDYPGDDYVDEVGLSGFNGGSALDWSGWRTFEDIYDQPLKELQDIAPRKPVQISEVSSAEAGGDKATWILEMFAYLRKHPEVRSMLWFDLRKQADWRLASSPEAMRAFARGLAGRPLGRDLTRRCRSFSLATSTTSFAASPLAEQLECAARSGVDGVADAN